MQGAGQPDRISDWQLAAGMFRGGASRLEFRDEALSITRLMVREPDLERALQLLAS